MNHKPPRVVIRGTQDRPVVIFVFSEGHRGWREKSVETPYNVYLPLQEKYRTKK